MCGSEQNPESAGAHGDALPAGADRNPSLCRKSDQCRSSQRRRIQSRPSEKGRSAKSRSHQHQALRGSQACYECHRDHQTHHRYCPGTIADRSDKQRRASTNSNPASHSLLPRSYSRTLRTMINDLWYKNAIFYCLSVATYMDANGDGVGDFQGLLRRLDYLHGMGVTALWLMPFQSSPGRDNGYDVNDYYSVDSRYGTLGDFVEFTHGCKQRGMRVIIGLGVNHTSDEHPWFM